MFATVTGTYVTKVFAYSIALVLIERLDSVHLESLLWADDVALLFHAGLADAPA